MKLEEKVYGLSLIWKEAEYNFAFWDNLKDLDWDKAYREALKNVMVTKDDREYYLELSKFISLLRDGHTGINFPQEMLVGYGVLPIEVMYLEKKFIITNASRELKDIIFNEIISVNGLPVQKYIEEKIFPYIWHEKPDSAYWQIFNLLPVIEAGSEINIETDRGIFKVKPVRKKVQWVNKTVLKKNESLMEIHKSSTLEVYTTPDNLSVIIIPTFNDNNLPNEFYGILPKIKDSKGFLIDLRWNGGGNSSNADAVAQAFIKGSFQSGRHKIPVHKGIHKAWGVEYRTMEDEIFSTEISECPVFIDVPLVLLENTSTASAAEDFLIMLDNINRAIIVGTPSYGSTGQPLSLALPGGGMFRICTRWCLYPDGKEFINTGVMPHVFADLSLDDYKNNTDSVFETGMKVLREKI